MVSVSTIKFSILIPTYNSESYIEECLNSIIAQTYTNYEVIIVDDGSTDSTPQLINKLINNYPQFKYIQNQHGGVCIARNTGISLATGDYICCVDSDDRVYPDYLESLAGAAEYSNPDVIYFYTKYGIDNRDRKEYSGELYTELDRTTLRFLASAAICHTPEIDSPDSHLYGISSFSAGGQAYKSTIFKDHGIRYSTGILVSEDGLLNLEMLYYAEKGIIIRKELYNYRTDNVSATRSYKPNLIDSFSKRNLEVKRLISTLYKDDPIFYEHYYCGLIYQIRMICENYIFHSDNKMNAEEKMRLFISLIEEPDYKKAIETCDDKYLPEYNRRYLEFSKEKNYTKINKYIRKNGNSSRLKRRIKKAIIHIRQYLIKSK